jgi:hypothetical protein
MARTGVRAAAIKVKRPFQSHDEGAGKSIAILAGLTARRKWSANAGTAVQMTLLRKYAGGSRVQKKNR